MPTTLEPNERYVCCSSYLSLKESETQPIEEKLRSKQELLRGGTSNKRPRTDMGSDGDDKDDHMSSSSISELEGETVEKVVKGPESVLGLIDRPHTLFTQNHIYYLWWKTPHRVFDFKV